MRVPQVSERIKEAPAQALRGVFAGIGQLLLITDKLRNKGSADSDVPRARTPEASETVTDTPVTSPVGQRAATAAATAEPATMEPAPAAPAPAETVAAGQAVAAGEAEPAPAKAATAQAATARRTAAKAADGAAKPAAAKSATAKAAAAKAAAKPATARPTAVKAAPAQPAAEAPPKPPKRQSIRDLDKTGNVRLLGDEADSSPLHAAAPVAAEPIAAAEPASAAAEPASAAAQIAVPEPVSVAEPSGDRRRCPITTSCPWRRCAPGCATSTSRRSGGSGSTSGRTPPGPMCWACSSGGSPSWRQRLSAAGHVG